MTTNLSSVQTAGLVLPVKWIDLPSVDPGDGETSVREQVIALGATHDQWLVGISEEGETTPFAFKAMNDSEFAGATFSADRQILYVNIQDPGMTFAIWGPWRRGLKR